MNLPPDKKIILFDGVCNLCDASVQFLIRHDKNDIFRFVALQSDLGQAILKHIGVDNKNLDSIVLYVPGVAYYLKSDAAIEISNALGNFFSLGIYFKIIPRFLRDPIYNFIAKNRYRWYGKKDECMIPTPATQIKFL